MISTKSKAYAAIMMTDFLVWSSSTGLYPLLSRMAKAELDEAVAYHVIAHMVLVFTVAAMFGRWVAGRLKLEAKTFVFVATVLCMLALFALFGNHPYWWYLGRGLQGFALGCYAISVMMMVSQILPAGRRMRGFALIGMADFLGFAFGPVISGLIVEAYGFRAALSCFLVLMFIAVLTSRLLPNVSAVSIAEPEEATQKSLPWHFLPLSAALFIGFAFHIYYGTFIPITVKTVNFPVETLFFAGYILGGLGFRLGFVKLLEKYEGAIAFAGTLFLMGFTSFMVSLWPPSHPWLDWMVVLTGVGYGLGFEALYIFSLSWVSHHTSLSNRARAFAVVFWGIDVAAVIAGLTFGGLVDGLGVLGLLQLLLWLNLAFVALPFALHALFRRRPKAQLNL